MPQMPSFSRRLALAFFLAVSACGGFWLGRFLFGPQSVQIDTARVETCLQAYALHRKDNSSVTLQEKLKRHGISPREFEHTIDRVIHFRISQSSLEQTRHLLEIIRLGGGIQPDKVVDGQTSEKNSLLLDAAIIKVFQENPSLVQEAFGG